MKADIRTPATDPVRQNIFITVALDALLTYHPEAGLRERTIAAYRRRLVRLGLVAPRPEGGEHGEWREAFIHGIPRLGQQSDLGPESRACHLSEGSYPSYRSGEVHNLPLDG